MEVIADTTLLIDLWRFRNRPERLQNVKSLLNGRAILLPWIARGEFLRGIFHQQIDESAVAPLLNIFESVWPDPLTVEIYAKTWAALARNGNLIDYPDLWIAAAALKKKIPVITRNSKHFEHVPDLEILAYSII